MGKGLVAPTLKAFVDFYQSNVDEKADTFFIDPDVNNPRQFMYMRKPTLIWLVILLQQKVLLRKCHRI